MTEIRHIFLTGDKKTGKSTMLKKALEMLELHPAGFETKPYELNGRFMGFYLHATGPLPQGYENDTPISVVPMPRQPIAITEVFDGFGAAVVTAARDAGTFVLMDELGRLEKNAFRFQASVQECLDGPCHVIGVLQKTDNEMIRKILSREDTLIYTVTTENRDALLPQLIRQLQDLSSGRR